MFSSEGSNTENRHAYTIIVYHMISAELLDSCMGGKHNNDTLLCNNQFPLCASNYYRHWLRILRLKRQIGKRPQLERYQASRIVSRKKEKSIKFLCTWVPGFGVVSSVLSESTRLRAFLQSVKIENLNLRCFLSSDECRITKQWQSSPKYVLYWNRNKECLTATEESPLWLF